MSNSWFQFKQFLVTQEKSALKVGTDGVLLGAWCNVEGAKQILDVGTGTGLIALMLAQRTDALIDAVEINEEAGTDACRNFQRSPWKDRITLHCADFNQFISVDSARYDLVVSNPPFFRSSLRSRDHAASQARHDITLSFFQLISGAQKILNKTGRLSVIIPVESLDDFRETARLAGLYLSRKTIVIPGTGKAPKRALLEFTVQPGYPASEELVILNANGQYSSDFVSLTKDFYLNFE